MFVGGLIIDFCYEGNIKVLEAISSSRKTTIQVLYENFAKQGGQKKSPAFS